MKIVIAIVLVYLAFYFLMNRARGSMSRSPKKFTVKAELGSNDEPIIALMRAGKKIEAIKQARETYGVGLKEAKEYVEALES